MMLFTIIYLPPAVNTTGQAIRKQLWQQIWDNVNRKSSPGWCKRSNKKTTL